MDYQCKTYILELKVAVKSHDINSQELLLESIEAINDTTDALVISGIIEEGNQ